MLWFYSALDDADAWQAALRAELPTLEICCGERVEDPRAIRLALVYQPPAGALAALPHLETVFSLAAGVDHLLADPTLPDVPLCRMVDPALTATIADYAHLAVLRVHRRFDVFAAAQREVSWAPALPRLSRDVVVTVLGLGELGAAVARRLADAGYAVRGWSRRPKALEGIDTYDGSARLEDAVADADVVLALLPGTPSTHDLFDAAFFARLKPGAHFVNLGRGEQLVDEALLEALDAGWLGGATLDVFRVEPLPATHPFWHHPKILVTPHVAGTTLPETGAKVVAGNIQRLWAGLPLRHVVDRRRGY